jgi:hypothetical protein
VIFGLLRLAYLTQHDLHFYPFFFIHSSVFGQLGCLQNLSIVNSAVINKGMLQSHCYVGVYSFKYMPKSGKTGLQNRLIFSVFLMNFHYFHSDCTRLNSHQQCVRVSFPLMVSFVVDYFLENLHFLYD